MKERKTLTKKKPMMDSRKYMVLLCLGKTHRLYESNDTSMAIYTEKFIYALGGVTMHSVGLKTVEKYDIERDRWQQVKC